MMRLNDRARDALAEARAAYFGLGKLALTAAWCVIALEHVEDADEFVSVCHSCATTLALVWPDVTVDRRDGDEVLYGRWLKDGWRESPMRWTRVRARLVKQLMGAQR